MNVLLWVASLLLGVALGYWFAVRPKTPKYFARGEYWVYIPGESLPDETAMMTRIVGRNPYMKKGIAPIGAAEGLLFSDVRTHFALVLKRKNIQAFRPDLFDGGPELKPGMIERLAEARAFVNIRYISDQVLPDKRHLQFLLHAADAVAELSSGALIYDQVAEKLWLRHELQSLLESKLDVTSCEEHVQIIWKQDQDGGRIETRGLEKIGLCELSTHRLPFDERILCTNIIEGAIRILWPLARFSWPIEVEAFGDQFRIVLDSFRGKFARVKILRIQSA